MLCNFSFSAKFFFAQRHLRNSDLNNGRINTMAVVIGGTGLGQFDVLGQSELLRTRTSGVAINGHSGNLIIGSQDQSLVSRGLDISLGRSYNSQGNSGDNWLFSFESHLQWVGDKVLRHNGDGHVATFIRHRDGRYLSVAGDGAHDTLEKVGNQWVYIEGSSQVRMTYSLSGRLELMADRHGNTSEFVYQGSRLSLIRDANGEELRLQYNSQGQVSRVDTYTRVSTGLSHTQSKVHYSYDAQGRLSSVKLDLTPEDKSIADGQVIETRYTYQSGNSHLLKSIDKTGGSKLSFVYQSVLGQSRLTELNDNGKVTRFGYQAAGGGVKMSVTEAGRFQWDYHFDSQGRLTKTESPSVRYAQGSNALPRGRHTVERGAIEYRYDDKNNLISMRETTGSSKSLTEYSYDDKGQLVTVKQQGVLRLRHSYYQGNRIKTESFDGSKVSTFHFVYDGERLRFTVSETGGVTEYRYNNYGQQVSKRLYSKESYTNAEVSVSSLEAWVEGQSLSDTQLNEYRYQRGLLHMVTRYGTLDSQGRGVMSSAVHEQSVYDAFGNLLSSATYTGDINKGTLTLQSGTTQVFDGSNRIIRQEDGEGRIVSTRYLDSSRQVLVEKSTGETVVRTFGLSGELVSERREGSSVESRTTSYRYDGYGQLLSTTLENGAVSAQFYDPSGRLWVSVSGTGQVTEYQRDSQGRVVKEIAYNVELPDIAQGVASGSLDDAEDILNKIPASSGHRVITTSYDGHGRVSESDNNGLVTRYQYNEAGQVLVRTVNGQEQERNVYDASGLRLATRDADGYVTRFRYNPAGQVTERRVLASPILDVGQILTREAGVLDERERHFYDASGRQSFVLDTQGGLTETRYLEGGTLVKTYRYHNSISPTHAGYSLSQLRSLGGSASVILQEKHNKSGQLIFSTDRYGVQTQYVYDTTTGLLKQSIAAANSSESRSNYYEYNAFGERTGQVRVSGKQAWQSARVSELIVRKGQRTTYNRMGWMSKEYHPESGTTTYEYDKAGRVIRATDNEDRTTRTSYTQFGEVKQVLKADGAEQSYEYDSLGRKVRSTMSMGDKNPYMYQRMKRGFTVSSSEIQYQYDHLGRLSYEVKQGVIDAALTSGLKGKVVERRVSHYQYDNRGNVIGLSKALSHRTGTTLSSSSESELGALKYAAQWTRKYDHQGRLISERDGEGRERVTSYQFGGRVTTRRLSGAIQERIELDAFGRVLSERDALERETLYEYDEVNRRSTVISPGGIRTVTEKNAHGEVVTVTDGEGHRRSFEYNHDGEVTGSYFQGKNDAHRTQLSKKEYDGNSGLLRFVTDGNGIRTEYRYYSDGRQHQVIQDVNGEAIMTTYRYGANGQLASKSRGGSTLGSWVEYDAQGRKVLSSSAGRVTQYSYDTEGNLVKKVEGEADEDYVALDERVTTYAYDASGNKIAQSVFSGQDWQGNSTAKSFYSMMSEKVSGYLDYAEKKTASELKHIKELQAHLDAVERHKRENPLYEELRVLENEYASLEQKQALDGESRHLSSQLTSLKKNITAKKGNYEYYQECFVSTQKNISSEERELASLGDDFDDYLDSTGPGSSSSPVSITSSTHETLYEEWKQNRETIEEHLSELRQELVHYRGLINTSKKIYDERVKGSKRYLSELSQLEDKVSNKRAELLSIDVSDKKSVSFYQSWQEKVQQQQSRAQEKFRPYLQNGKYAAIDQDSVYLSYNDAGQIVARIDDSGAVTRYAYDGKGQLQFEISALNYVTEYKYNENGQKTHTIRHAKVIDLPQASQSTAFVASRNRELETEAAVRQLSMKGLQYENRLQALVDYEALVVVHEQLRKDLEVSRNYVDMARNELEEFEERMEEVLYNYNRAQYYDRSSDEPRTHSDLTYEGFTVEGGSLDAELEEYYYEFTSINQRRIDTEKDLVESVAREKEIAKLLETHRQAIKIDNNMRLLSIGEISEALTKQYETHYTSTLSQLDEKLTLLNNQRLESDRLLHAFSQSSAVKISQQTVVNALKGSKARTEETRYDDEGRIWFEIDAGKYYTEFRYDNNGNLQTQIRYSMPNSRASRAENRFTEYFYDAQGRQTFTVDHLGRVSEHRYDAEGQRTHTLQHDIKISSSLRGNRGVIERALNNLNESTARHSQVVYDGLGRVRFKLDASGYLIENQYDASNNLIKKKEFISSIDSALNSARKAHPSLSELSLFEMVAREARKEPAQEEAELRDMIAKLDEAISSISSTKKNNTGVDLQAVNGRMSQLLEQKASMSWQLKLLQDNQAISHDTDYQYDKKGQLIGTLSARVHYVDVEMNGSLSHRIERLQTTHHYDGLGNVVETISAAGTTMASTQRFVYDVHGNQIRSIGLAGSQVSYGRHGLATNNVNANGERRDKVYDAGGQLRFEVDELGYVTEYRYNAYGQREKVLRYSRKLHDIHVLRQQSASLSLKRMETFAQDYSDSRDKENRTVRRVATIYDDQGREERSVTDGVAYGTEKMASASMTYSKSLSAFGEVLSSSQSLTQSGKTTSVGKSSLYNSAGQLIVEKDAEGYLTAYEYNNFGERVLVKELDEKYNGAWNEDAIFTFIESGADGKTRDIHDRKIRKIGTSYNKLGLIKSTTLHQVWIHNSSGKNEWGDIVTQQTYDYAGRLAESRTIKGNEGGKATSERFQYDALGRMTTQWGKQSQVLLSDKAFNTHIRTDIHYDVHGNQAAKLVSGLKQNSVRYDATGRLVARFDGKGQRTDIKVDAMNRVVEERQILKAESHHGYLYAAVRHYKYDASGRQLSTTVSQRDLGKVWEKYTAPQLDGWWAQGRKDIQAQESTYNAYGEVVSVVGGGKKQINDHDLLGRVVTSTLNNSLKTAYEYNLHGKVTKEIVQGKRITLRLYDNLGRIKEEKGPSFENGKLVPTTKQEYDRWGNITSKTVNNSRTDFIYDERNHLIRQDLASTEVISSDSQKSSPARATTLYKYDWQGNLIKTQDANGYLTISRYSASGQKLSETNAENETLSWSYDGRGNEVLVAGKSGENVYNWSEYDRNNRKIYIGKRLQENGAYSNKVIKSYSYDVAGNRYMERNHGGVSADTNTRYDAAGRITSANGNYYAYDMYGLPRSVTSRYLSPEGSTSAWTDEYDDAYRLKVQVLDDGTRVWYEYDDFGQVKRKDYYKKVKGQEVLTVRQSFTYFENGLLCSRTTTFPTTDRKPVRETFEYDANGRMTSNRQFESTDEAASAISETYVTYDDLGRIKSVSASGMHDARYDSTITYGYDAVGNRRKVVTQFGSASTKTEWNTFDKVNREVKSGGVTYTYDHYGRKIKEQDGNKTRAYSYDDYGYLHKFEETESGSNRAYRYTQWNHRSGHVERKLTYSQSAITKAYQYGTASSDYTIEENEETYKYLNGKLSTITVKGIRAGTQRDSGDRGYFSENKQKIGELYRTSFKYHVKSGGIQEQSTWQTKSRFSQTQYTQYKLIGDEYKRVKITSEDTRSKTTPGVTTFDYDPLGNLTGTSMTGGKTDKSRYITTGDGQILHKWSNTLGSREVYVQGKHIATVDIKGKSVNANLLSDSPSDVSGSPSMYTVATGDTLKDISTKVFGDSRYWYLIADANGLSFDSALEPGLVLTIPNVSAQNYNGADTFKPYNESEILGDVTPQILPPPPPKKSCNPVAIVIMVVVAVVVTVFTAGAAAPIIAGATTGGVAATGATTFAVGLSTLAGGGSLGVALGAAAIGGAMGSAASQLVGKAMGVVDDFSWSQVAMGAATSVASAGMGYLGNMTNTVGEVARHSVTKGAASYATNYLGNKALGKDVHFRWNNLAASVAGSYIGNELNVGMEELNIEQNILTDSVTGFIGAGASSAIRGDSFRDNAGQLALDAFGNALGNVVRRGMRQHADAVEERKNISPIFDWRNKDVKYDMDGYTPIFDWRTTGPNTTEAFPLSEEDLPSNRHWNERDILIEEKEAALASHFANLETKQKRGINFLDASKKLHTEQQLARANEYRRQITHRLEPMQDGWMKDHMAYLESRSEAAQRRETWKSSWQGQQSQNLTEGLVVGAVLSNPVGAFSAYKGAELGGELYANRENIYQASKEIYEEQAVTISSGIAIEGQFVKFQGSASVSPWVVLDWKDGLKYNFGAAYDGQIGFHQSALNLGSSLSTVTSVYPTNDYQSALIGNYSAFTGSYNRAGLSLVYPEGAKFRGYQFSYDLLGKSIYDYKHDASLQGSYGGGDIFFDWNKGLKTWK
ncbi:LysM peptidoglycan-binding domain-containing protein [Vibrio vulnificus]|nr:LysM peptidoglycan-binding domain-containing protein [Vibrio vulnificus]